MSATVAAAGTRPAIEGSRPAGIARRASAACAGPLLIVLAVAFALRGFAFHPLITNAQVDILSFWLPRFAFLGRSIAAGHVPLWNPYEMAGYRFAADPQSGWLYAPAMLLFSVLNPGSATRALIVLNPMLGGLALYAFCRREGLARVAATAAGLSTAMIVSTSEIAISLPFAGILAWTPVVLLGAAGYRRSDRWSRRIAWLALGVFGWSQVASAHMSHGLVMCTLLVSAYLVAAAVSDVREHRVSVAAAAGLVALFLVLLPLGSLALLIPRLAFIRASSLHAGYGAVGDAGKGSSAGQEAPIRIGGTWAGWPFAFAMAPGPYAGAAILLAVPLAVRARRWRHLTWGFGSALVITYISMADLLLSRSWFQRLILRVPFGDVYLHNPGRFRYVAVIAIPVLGAVGIQGLADNPMPWRRALAWLGAGSALWLALPIALGGVPARFALFAMAAVVGIPVLFLLATRKVAWAAAGVIAVLFCELLTSAAWSQRTSPYTVIASGLEPRQGPDQMPQPLTWPNVSQQEFLQTTPFVAILRGTQDRFLTYAPPASSFDKGYLFAQRPQDWPALAMERGTLFQIHDTLGYNPVQLPRYWSYIRTIDPLPVFYNASVINIPNLEDARMLGVRYLTVPTGVEPTSAGTVVARDRGYDLVEVTGWEPRVSVVQSWSVVAGPDDSLREATRAGFDPARSAILEQDPGIGSQIPPPPNSGPQASQPASAAYTEASPENVTVAVDAPSPSIVVVRNAFDPGWSATVDGRPAPVLPTDFLLQGVAVGAGHHVVRLTYRDAEVTLGMRAGIVVWFLLLATFLAAAIWERRDRRNHAGASPARVEERLGQDSLTEAGGDPNS